MTDLEKLIDMRQTLGEIGFINALWSMREAASPPAPKPFTRAWRWSPAKVVSLQAYRKEAQKEYEDASSGRGLG